MTCAWRIEAASISTPFSAAAPEPVLWASSIAAWMDRPFAFAAEDGGAVGLHAEAVRVAVIAEWAVYRHQAVRARGLHHTEQREVPEVVPVADAFALLVLVGEHDIIGIAPADVGGAHALAGGIVGRAEMKTLQTLRGTGDLVDIGQAEHTFDDNFEADLLLAAHRGGCL